MKIKSCIAAMLLLCVQGRVGAQPDQAVAKTASPVLSVGGKCSNISMHLLNTNQKISFSDYKGKIVILCFFSHICGACIGELPALNALQQQEKNKLQIILVTTEPAAVMQAFFKTNKFALANILPVVAGDKTLSALFPYKLVPHTVWLDTNRTVRAITSGDVVTEENITALLNDKNFSLPLKEDLVDFDAAKLLLQNGNGGSADNIFFRSTFSRYISGIESKSAIYTASNYKRYLNLNLPVMDLYEEALGGIPVNRILLRVKDSAYFKKRPDGKWAGQNLFCYELIAPAGADITALHAWMQQDIERCFAISGSFEKVLMPCYAILPAGTGNIPVLPPHDPLAFTEDSIVLPASEELSALTGALNNAALNSSSIFVDSNAYKLPAGISISLTGVHDTGDLQKLLNQYGIIIMPQQQTVEMFVITNAAAPQALALNP